VKNKGSRIRQKIEREKERERERERQKERERERKRENSGGCETKRKRAGSQNGSRFIMMITELWSETQEK